MSRWDPETQALVTAAIRVAIGPPPAPRTVSSYVSTSAILQLREALEAIGIDWRAVRDKARAGERRP